jgi:hypothetical protein
MYPVYLHPDPFSLEKRLGEKVTFGKSVLGLLSTGPSGTLVIQATRSASSRKRYLRYWQRHVRLDIEPVPLIHSFVRTKTETKTA